MGQNIKVIDNRNGAAIEVDPGLIGLVSLTDGTGRKHITVKNLATGVKENVGTIDGGEVTAQAGYAIELD